MTRKQWKEEVIHYLESIANNHYLDKTKAQKLLDADIELDRIAEKKRKSTEKQKMMRKINGTETIKVNKKKNEELKALLSRAMECIE